MADSTYKYQSVANNFSDIFTTTVSSSGCPQNMFNINATVNENETWINLTWEEPLDTTTDTDDTVTCSVSGIVIIRKKDSAPTGINDGNLVLHVARSDFGNYISTAYADKSITFENGTYYYGFFPYSANNGEEVYNVSSNNITSVEYSNADIVIQNRAYGFTLDTNESNPATNITYIGINTDYNSAKMNYSTNTFDYGDWENIWFIKNCKPCMLKYDGTVDYYLDKNDYTLREDGTASDIANSSYDGNVMIEIPLVYYKIIDNNDGTYSFYFSDKEVDSTFRPWWSFYDKNGNVINHTYMAAYSGSNVSSVLRSISGTTNMYNQTAATEISYANANNTNGGVSNIWYTEVYSDRQLINMLLMLIGKSTDTQTVFGNGNVYFKVVSGIDAYVSTNIIKSGTMNQKGLFWGSNSTTTYTGVKVFGIENYWANQIRRIGGWINDNGTQKIKLTWGKTDGTTTTGYNTDGSGYIAVEGATPSGSTGGYISKCMINEYGIIPYQASGSDSTYECDALLFNNTRVSYAYISNGSKLGCGAFAVGLDAQATIAGYYGAALSCKPLATTA